MENTQISPQMIMGGIVLIAAILIGAVAFTPRNRSDVLGTSTNNRQGMFQLMPVGEMPGVEFTPER